MFKKILSPLMAFIALALGLLAAPAAMAQATLPSGVEEAIENAGAMLVLGATTVIIALVAFWGLKKLGTKLGWW